MDTEKVKKINKPDCVKDEYLCYLDDLRDSGITNMFGARPYLMKEFPELSKQDSSEVLSYWMETF